MSARVIVRKWIGILYASCDGILRLFIYFSQKISMLSIVLEGYVLYFVGMTSCILSETYLVNILILFMISR